MAKVNWSKVEREYITGKLGQIKLAEKYNVNKTTLAKKCKEEEWVKKRKEYRRKTQEKALQKIEEKVIASEVDRATKLLGLADKLTEKLEKAIDELDIYVAKDKLKVKEIEYDVTGQKPVKEIIQEEEKIGHLKTTINILGAQQIATALKTLKDINTSIGASDEEVEADGLLEALNQQIDTLYDADDDSDMLPSEEDS